MALAAPRTTRCGVIEWKPFGTGLTGMTVLLPQIVYFGYTNETASADPDSRACRRAKHAAHHVSVHAKFGSGRDGPYGRPLRRFLQVRLRSVDQEQPDAAGPVVLGRLREARRREPA